MLWIYGDSYSANFVHLKSTWSWVRRINQRLACESKNFSFAGSGLGYTYCKFNETCDQFSEGDHVIITLTSLNRRYFFYDQPMLVNLWNLKYPSYDMNGDRIKFNPSEADAFRKYFMFLDKNTKLEEVNLINFLTMVDSISRRKKLGSVTIMSCFEDSYLVAKTVAMENAIVASGWLYKISTEECAREELVSQIQTDDKRACHLSQHNHGILLSKLYNSIVNKTPLDLTQGFKKGFIHEVCDVK
jgi:hypothetical protein